MTFKDLPHGSDSDDGRRRSADRRDLDRGPERRSGADRRFGRARNLSIASKCRAVVLDFGYQGGWAASLAHRVGLQGRLRTTEHEFTSPHLPADAEPLRFVFASDFHAGPTTHPDRLEEACRAIEAARPHLLLLGGDYVGWRARDADVLAERLGCIAAPLGRFAVLGNHDLIANDEHVVEHFERAGVEMLTNRSVQLPAPYDGVWVCGIDDPEYGEPDAESALAGADGARIVIMHAPDGLLHLGDHRFDVAMCGHVHGGQVALPGGVPIVVPNGALCRRYPHGEHRVGPGGRSTLLVSRGIGCSGVPVRLFAPPEIHVCTLRGGG
jgi:uncharacterized protein